MEQYRPPKPDPSAEGPPAVYDPPVLSTVNGIGTYLVVGPQRPDGTRTGLVFLVLLLLPVLPLSLHRVQQVPGGYHFLGAIESKAFRVAQLAISAGWSVLLVLLWRANILVH